MAPVLLWVPLACAAQTYDDWRCRFSHAGLTEVGTAPTSIAAADLNGDRRADLVTADEGSNTVTVLRSLGDGHFALTKTLAVGASPQAVALHDLNHDGRPDLLIAAGGSNALEVRFGEGGGKFTAAASFAAGSFPHAIAVADFNADGHPDVAVAASLDSQVSVLLGDGKGGFAAKVGYGVGGYPYAVSTADLNGDGKPDLAVANQDTDSVSVLLNAGNGGFGAATAYAVGDQPRGVAIGDLTADGKPDLVVANWNSSNLSLLVGAGNGTFAPAVAKLTFILPTALAIADLDGDAAPELVVGHDASYPNQVSMLRGLPGGGLAPASTLLVLGVRPRAIALGDFNADGRTDLAAVGNASDQVVSMLLGCAPAMNNPPRADVDLGSSYQLRKSPLWVDRSHPGTFTHVMIHQDIDRDGDTDLVRASLVWNVDTPIEVLLNAAGVFSDQTAQVIPTAHPPMRYPRKGLNGDFNDDGWMDFVILDTGDDAPPFPGAPSAIYLSDGGGKLHYSSQLVPYSGYSHGGAAGDIDGNGTLDLLVFDTNALFAYLMVNDGSGNFTFDQARLPAELIRFGYYTAEMIDVDLDGYIDILASGNELRPEDTGVVVYWGGPTGLYRKSSSTVIPKPPGYGGVLDIAAEDIDHDGDRDLIISRFPDDTDVNERFYQILPQVANRQFVDETASRMTMKHAENSFDFLRTQDINGDGHLDIFVDDRSFEATTDYAWTNNGNGVFAPYSGPVNPVLPVTTIDIADESVVEGAAGTRQLVFTVRLNKPATAPVAFNIATGAGTATAGSDYVAKSSNGVVIGVGQSSAQFSVTVNGDTLLESDEAFQVLLSSVTGAKVLRGHALGYIDNDDDYQLSINDVSVNEGNAGSSQAIFTVSLSAPAPGPVGFDIATTPGTATVGTDYTASVEAGRSIPAGQTSATYAVGVLGDTAIEPHETFTVRLSNATGANIVDAEGRGRIINDDQAQLAIADASTQEGQGGRQTLAFVVTLSRPMPNPVSFDIATSNGSATSGSDYVARNVVGRFLDVGRTRWRFEVAILGDGSPEPDETFTVAISNVNGAALADGTAVGTILNDDLAAQRRTKAKRLGKPRP